MSSPSSSSSGADAKEKNMVVDPFCFRQFGEHVEKSKNYGGTVFRGITVSEFEAVVNERFDETDLHDGYAPFCKHLFVANDFLPNGDDAAVNVLEITSENERMLRTKYEARNDKELPVLARYFPKDLLDESGVKLPAAKYLDLILYSREQIRKENAAQGDSSAVPEHDDVPWGIVSIKAQDVDYELPMNPITVMRNALGKEEGGSGVPMNRDEYMKSVDYWKRHAVIS